MYIYTHTTFTQCVAFFVRLHSNFQPTILAKTIDYTLDIFAPFGVPDCQFISNDPPRPQNNVESLPNALNMLWDTIQH